MTPTADQIAHYREQGYVQLSGVVSPEMLDTLMAELDGPLYREQGELATWQGPWRAGFEGGERFKLRIQKRLGKKAGVWHDWLKSRELLDPVEALAGVALESADAMLIIKPPEVGQAFPPHQDSAYYASDQPDYLIASLALHATNTENGAVRYLPGSHKNGLRDHMRGEGKAYMPEISLDDLVEVPTQVGDLVCSNIHTVHGSPPNRSKGPRALVRIGFQPR